MLYLFKFVGLCTLIGIIIYISAITEEAGSKPRPTMDEPKFQYSYGPSFAMTISSFVSSELTGVLSVYLYIVQYQHAYHKTRERAATLQKSSSFSYHSDICIESERALRYHQSIEPEQALRYHQSVESEQALIYHQSRNNSIISKWGGESLTSQSCLEHTSPLSPLPAVGRARRPTTMFDCHSPEVTRSRHPTLSNSRGGAIFRSNIPSSETMCDLSSLYLSENHKDGAVKLKSVMLGCRSKSVGKLQEQPTSWEGRSVTMVVDAQVFAARDRSVISLRDAAVRDSFRRTTLV